MRGGAGESGSPAYFGSTSPSLPVLECTCGMAIESQRLAGAVCVCVEEGCFQLRGKMGGWKAGLRGLAHRWACGVSVCACVHTEVPLCVPPGCLWVGVSGIVSPSVACLCVVSRLLLLLLCVCGGVGVGDSASRTPFLLQAFLWRGPGSPPSSVGFKRAVGSQASAGSLPPGY